jgi:hypothetical protein
LPADRSPLLLQIRVLHIIYAQANKDPREIAFRVMDPSSDFRFSTEVPSFHGRRFPFHVFAFLRQLKRFPKTPFRDAETFHIWRSNRALAFRFWANLRLRAVSHFDRFVFLHQLRQYRKTVSTVAKHLRVCLLRAIASSAFFPDWRLHSARLFNRFVFLRQLKLSP